MMATTEPENIPQTIRSRCQHYSFHAVRFDDILAQLRSVATQENLMADEAALAILAEAGDGSMRDALSIMDQAIASATVEDGQAHLTAEAVRDLMGTVPNTVFERLLNAIHRNQSAEVLEELDRLLNAGNSPAQLARQFVRYLRNALMAKIGGEQTGLLQLSPDERARANGSAALFSEEDLTRFLQIMLRTFDELNYRQEQRFHLELGLVKLVHLQRLLPMEQFLSQLPAKALTASAPAQPNSAMRPAASALPTRTAPASTARTSPAASPRLEEPARPAFSPFEADRQRKMTQESAVPAPVAAAPLSAFSMPSTAIGFTSASTQAISEASPEASEEMPAPTSALPVAVASSTARVETASYASAPAAFPAEVTPALNRPLTPFEAASRAAESTPAKPASGLGSLNLENATEGALALAVESSQTEGTNLDQLAEAVCAALEQEGHNTAAVLLASGQWRHKGDAIEVEVPIKRVMLGLTMNAEAEKIAKNTLRSLGMTQKLVFVPGEAATGASAKPKVVISGSVQTMALEDPLVQKAKELFRGEVRSILDLRGK